MDGIAFSQNATVSTFPPLMRGGLSLEGFSDSVRKNGKERKVGEVRALLPKGDGRGGRFYPRARGDDHEGASTAVKLSGSSPKIRFQMILGYSPLAFVCVCRR